jgi:hypothetical protein
MQPRRGNFEFWILDFELRNRFVMLSYFLDPQMTQMDADVF